MEIIGIRTPIFSANERLFDFLVKNIKSFNEGDIVVITSKIVALSEGRVAIEGNKDEIIRRESKKIVKTPWALLTLTDSGWGINAGVDESNANECLILLPKNSFKTAEFILKKIKKEYSLDKLGIIITDTKSIPLRVGTIGRAIGFAGFKPLKSYIGRKDLYGRKSRLTISNQVDALSAAAVSVMGEGDERIPIALIKDAPVTFTRKIISQKEKNLSLPPEKDIYSKIFILAEQESHKLSKKK